MFASTMLPFLILSFCFSSTLEWSVDDIFMDSWKTPRIQTGCYTNGYICGQNCKILQACVTTPTGYQKIDIQTCPGETVCSAENKSCVASGASSCSTAPTPTFTCTGQGAFPDPFDCTKYHVCITGSTPNSYTGDTYDCPDGYVYNSLSGSCDITYPNDICSEPVPKCQSIAQSGPLTQNPSIFYLCMLSEGGTLYPELTRCPHGYYLADGCVDGQPDLCSTFTCAKEGMVGDPKNCTMFYYCFDDLTLSPLHSSCDYGYHFDTVTLECVEGSDCSTY